MTEELYQNKKNVELSSLYPPDNALLVLILGLINIIGITFLTAPFNFLWINSEGYCNQSGFCSSKGIYLMMYFGIYLPNMLGSIHTWLQVFTFLKPNKFDKIYNKLLPLALAISNGVLIFFYTCLVSKISKELLLDIHMEDNSIINFTREFGGPSSSSLFHDMRVFFDYFNQCFPILSYISFQFMITDVVPLEVFLCGILYYTSIGAWLGNLIDVPVLLYLIGNDIKKVLNLKN